MPPERDDEDEIRDEFMLAFEAFDKGDLTHENAHTFELPEPPAPKNLPSDGTAAPDAESAASGRGDVGADNSRDGQRDGRGRFAKGEGDGATGDKPAGATTPPIDGGNPAAAQQQATPGQAAPAEHEPAPQGLSTKAAAVWGTATPEARAYIRETESILEQVSQRLTPVMEAAKDHQLPWQEYAGRLVKADKFLRSSPMDAMLWLMETHKVDPDALADMAAAKRAGITLPTQQQPHPDIHRAVEPLAAQVQEIRGQLQQQQQNATAQAEREANARREATKREYNAFAEANKEHWKDVEPQILQSIAAYRAQKPDASAKEILQTAYDAAIWANPVVRAKLIAAQTRQTQNAGRSSRSRDLESMTGHRGGPTTPGRKATNGSADPLRDEIQEHFAAYDAR